MEKKLMFFKNNYVEIGPYNQINTEISIVFFIVIFFQISEMILKFFRIRPRQTAPDTQIEKRWNLFSIELERKSSVFLNDFMKFLSKTKRNTKSWSKKKSKTTLLKSFPSVLIFSHYST